MQAIKKYLAECIGTFVLVFVACGTAAALGCSAEPNAAYFLTAAAFGLVIVAMAYSIGNVPHQPGRLHRHARQRQTLRC